MKPFKTDIAVAMIFFNRPDTLKTVFESVREAQPSKLYLIQDGARANRPKDVENVAKCREVVSNIDWECEVVHDYSDINLGCGKRIFTGLSNVFMHEEYAAIVEDDIVIGESFLPFCKEMCERYKDDQRIHMISGMNHLGVYEECPYDYFFSQGGGAIWGWATWARCWNELDWNMEAVSNNYIVNCLKNGNTPNNVSKVIAERALVIRQGILKGVSPTFWSLHFGLYGYLGSRLNIVPKYNLISNIGLTGDSAHATDSVNKLVKRIRVVFFSKIYEMPNKLRHPKYIIDDQ
ncbi:hemolysin activation protein, partial [Bacteroides acidifaciens]